MSAGTFVSPKKDSGGNLRTAASLWDRLIGGWSRFADSRALAYLFFAVAYIVPNVVLARHKLIWDDEFFTLYLSRIPNWTELWRALSTGADQHPPSFYYLTHLIFNIAGTTHVTLRLTALVGFGLSCICLFEIARQMIGTKWGVPAMLLPLTTPALYYASEARGYGLELGFVSFSLLTWILAAEGKKRAWTVPALAVSLCLAVASHYYAVLFLVPLVLGELVKIKRNRSIDVPVCCAIFAGLIPLIVFAPLLLNARTYSGHFWAVPHWGQMLYWYSAMTGRMPLILISASALAFVLRIPASKVFSRSAPEVKPPIIMVVTASALLPVLGGAIAELITHAFTERYFIAAFPGTVILSVWGLQRIFRNDMVGPALASLLCLVLSVQQWRDLRANEVTALLQTKSIAALLRKTPDAPVVVSEVTVFHRLSFYARRDLASRLVYVADPHLSVRYLGHDTIDRGLLALTPWFPLRIMWWPEWWRAHPFSLVYGYVGEWTWLTFALREIGAVNLLERDVSHLLFKVTSTNPPSDDRLPGDPAGKPMLYDRLPTAGPPLCNTYMPADACPIVDDPSFTMPIISYPDFAK